MPDTVEDEPAFAATEEDDVDSRLVFEDPSDAENTAIFWASEAETLGVTVAEEQAMDSYNQTFECTFHLSRDQALQLRALIETFFAT